MHTSFPYCHPNSFSLLPSNHLTIIFHQADLSSAVYNSLSLIWLPSTYFQWSLKGCGKQQSHTLACIYTLLPSFSASMLLCFFFISCSVFTPLPHLTFVILKPRGVTMPSAFKFVLTFLCPWKQCLVSTLNISSRCALELLSFFSLLLFLLLNPIFLKKWHPHPLPFWCQIHERTVEKRGRRGCCLDTYIWYLRDHRAEI